MTQNKLKSYLIKSKVKFSTASGTKFEQQCLNILKNNCKFFNIEKNLSQGYFLKEKDLRFILTSKSWFYL